MLCFVLFLFVGLVASEFDHEIHHKFETLPSQDFVSYFNSLNHSWLITDYSEDIHMHLGAKLDAYGHGLATMTHDETDLPQNFDAREKWPQCGTIRRINNQQNCGSCYLFGTINSVSDRICIHNNVSVHLSEQEGDCIQPSTVCDGGSPSAVLNYWITNGLVSEECKPYDNKYIDANICFSECVDHTIDYRHDKHYGRKAYRVEANINAIRAEIVRNGPVVTGFAVFSDFKKYYGGVYQHKFGRLEGYHAVRVIGFGTNEQGKDYWLVANSWGPYWGDEGFVKIERGQHILDFERNVFAGLPRKY